MNKGLADHPSNLNYHFCTLKIKEEDLIANIDDASKYLHQISGSIILSMDDDESHTTIGIFALMIADIESACIDKVSAYDVLDSDTSSLAYFEALYESGAGDFKESVVKIACGDDYIYRPNLLMLERLVIFPEHRGRGVGLTVLRTLIERYRMGMGLIAMKPYPLQYEFFREDEVEDIPRAVLGLDLFHGSHAASTKKLKAYYGRLGFKNVPRTGYMVRDAIAPLTE